MQILGGQQQTPQIQSLVDAIVREMESRRQAATAASPAQGVPALSSPSGPVPVVIVGPNPLPVIVVGSKAGKGIGGQGGWQTPDEFMPGRRRNFRTPGEHATGAAQQAYGQGSGLIGRAASAADPFSTMATLEGSIQGLSIEVGKSFLPMIDAVSMKVQEATKWFASLEESTKTAAAKFAFWAVVGAGVVTMGAKIVATVRMIASAMAATRAVMMAHPVGAILTAVGAVVALKAAWDGVSNAARSAGDASRNARPEDRKAENAISEKDLRSLPADVQKKIAAAGGDRGKVVDVLQEFQRKAAEELEKKKGQTIPSLQRLQQQDEAVNKAFDRSGLSGRIDRYRAGDQREMREAEDKWKSAGGFWEVGRQTSRLFSATNNFMRGDGFAPTMQSQHDPAVVRESQRERALAVAQSMLPAAMKALKDSGVDAKQEDVFARLLAAVRRDDDDPMRRRDGEPVLSASDRRRFAAEAAGMQIEGQLKKLEDQKKLAGDLLKKSGGADDLQRSLRGLPQTQIMDPAAYADKIQQGVLNGDDLDAQNRIKQLEALERTNDLLTDIKTGLGNLRVEQPWRY